MTIPTTPEAAKVVTPSLEELSENGSKEATRITVIHKGQKYKAIIVMDFALYRKAYAILMSPKIEKKDGKSDVTVETDIGAAGDKLLFMGWHSGNEAIKKNLRLRVQAGTQLGAWLMNIAAGGEDDQVGEKKS